MSEQFKGEHDPAPESKEDQLRAAWGQAVDKENSVREAIREVYANTPDPDEAARIIDEQYAAEYERAHEESKTTFKAIRDYFRQKRDSEQVS